MGWKQGLMKWNTLTSKMEQLFGSLNEYFGWLLPPQLVQDFGI
jgi:hypothetical protein